MASLFIRRACIVRFSVLKQIQRQQIFRTFVDKKPQDVLQTNTFRRLKDRLISPATDLPFIIGKVVLFSAGILGLGLLCFYREGYSGEPSAIDKSMFWPQYVKDRLITTYLCFLTATTVTTIFCVLAFRSSTIMKYVSRNNLLGMIISMAAIYGTGIITQKTEFKPGGIGLKHVFWMIHAATTGCVLAPMCRVGGFIWLKAAFYTWIIIIALSAIAMSAPSDEFLMKRAPIAMCLALALTSTFGSQFLPPITTIGAALKSISMYIGIIAFSGFLLFDTQRIIIIAKEYPYNPPPGIPVYDPINAGMEMYMDVFNMFIRVLAIVDVEDLVEVLIEEIWKRTK